MTSTLSIEDADDDEIYNRWEPIHDYELYIGEFITTHRMKVFNGWLVMINRTKDIEDPKWKPSYQFIRDPIHEWKLEKAPLSGAR